MLTNLGHVITIAWVLIPLWGAIHHCLLWREVQDAIRLLDAGVVEASAGARMLFINDADNELDWTAVKLAFSVIGFIRATQASIDPLTLQGTSVVILLLAVVLWARLRSEIRSRRRRRIIRSVKGIRQ